MLFGGDTRGVSVGISSSGILDILGGGPKIAGITVTPDNAMTFGPVYACVSYIARMLGTVPNIMYKRTKKGQEMALDHSTYRLLKTSPNAKYTSVNFRKSLFTNALLTGNGYARIYRNKLGQPLYFELKKSSQVNPFLDRDDDLWYWDYEKSELVSSENMIHLAALGFNGITGKSPITLARETIGLGMAASRFGAKFYENGGFMSGYLKHPNKLDPESAARLRSSMRAIYQGIDNAGRIGIFEEGMEFEKLEMGLKDAQFLESRKFQAEEVCRWFGVPPHKVALLERSTNNNIESQSIEAVQDCLLPWAVAYEQEIDKKVFYYDSDEYFNKLEMKGLLRGDLKARQEFYKTMLEYGPFSINDVLALEDMNPVEGGDARLVQVNRIPLTHVDKYADKLVANAQIKQDAKEKN